MEIYGIKTCDTCRKATKALPDARFVDVRSDGISKSLIDRAREVFGDALINTRSTTWRGLSETERAQDHETLLSAHPTLMKRPLIVDGDTLHLGWNKETQAALGV
ncbi:MAG: ArsC/Spx/MgsR family protein [Pseudomonadota bacterium]